MYTQRREGEGGSFTKRMATKLIGMFYETAHYSLRKLKNNITYILCYSNFIMTTFLGINYGAMMWDHGTAHPQTMHK